MKYRRWLVGGILVGGVGLGFLLGRVIQNTRCVLPPIDGSAVTDPAQIDRIQTALHVQHQQELIIGLRGIQLFNGYFMVPQDPAAIADTYEQILPAHGWTHIEPPRTTSTYGRVIASKKSNTCWIAFTAVQMGDQSGLEVRLNSTRK